MKLTQEVIDDVRNSASISEVIGHYIPLQKKGRRFTALCPFHNDHDPSLSINDEKQIYKCFVCGNGGNVFTFVSNFKKISFPESVIEVASVIGKPLNIDYTPYKPKEDKNKKYHDLLNSMIEYSSYLLTGSKIGEEAKKYLTNRGLDDEIIEKFNIGYNPSDNVMYKHLSSKSFKDEDMVKVGITRMMDYGMADIFYNRVLFPIHDEYGNPIAFSARDITNSSNAKYINTSETLIYTKGNTVYNYHRAKEDAKKANMIIVVEGVMDVIAMSRAGINYVVATLGTAATREQLNLIEKLSNNIVLAYDSDNAGRAANLKLGEMALEKGLNVQVIENNTGKDPDEIVNEHGVNALRDLCSKKITYLDYAISYYKDVYNLDNYNDRKDMTIKVTRLIDMLKDEYDRNNYSNELYSLTKLRKRDNKVDKKEYNSPVIASYSNITIDGLTKAEYTILAMMAMKKEAVDIFEKDLGYLLDETNGKLAMLIIDSYRKSGRCRLASIFDETDDQNIKNLILNISTAEGIKDDYDKDTLVGSINKVKREIKKEKLNDLKNKIKQNEKIDPVKANEYLSEYVKLVKELGGN